MCARSACDHLGLKARDLEQPEREAAVLCNVREISRLMPSQTREQAPRVPWHGRVLEGARGVKGVACCNKCVSCVAGAAMPR